MTGSVETPRFARRVVEVLADNGPSARASWSTGSGLMVGPRVVVTAAHVITSDRVYVRVLADQGKVLLPAEVVDCGDVSTVDLALLRVLPNSDSEPDWFDELTSLPFATVDRGSSLIARVDGCAAVGFPRFMEIGGTGHAGPPLRETAQVDGYVPVLSGLVTDMLTLRVTSAPRSLQSSSAWSGMSGAVVVAAGQVIGVITEHNPQAGTSELQVTPIAHVDRLPTAGLWWRTLGVRTGNRLPSHTSPLLPVNLYRASELKLVEAGVHPAAERPGHGADDHVRYFIRDHDESLREQIGLGAGGRIVVVGASSTGKSRSIYEAIRAVLPDWNIYLPSGPEALLRSVHELPTRTVVWLDDTPTPRFFLPDTAGKGLSVDDLATMTAGPADRLVVVVQWPDHHRGCMARPPVQADGRVGTDPYARARAALVTFAAAVYVPDRLSLAERERASAAARRDSRIAAALADQRYGEIQHLAGAPEIVDRYLHAEPYTRGLIDAAMDVARLGVRSPMSEGLLNEAAAGSIGERYSAEQPHLVTEAPADWFARALASAGELRTGHTALLHRVPTDPPILGASAGYKLTDYLHQASSRFLRHSPTPPAVWLALEHHLADPEDMAAVGAAAEKRSLLRLAEIFYRKAGRTSLVASLLGRQERIDELRDLARSGDVGTMEVLTGYWAARNGLDELRALEQAGHPSARRRIVRLLIDQAHRNPNGGHDQLRQRAAAGDPDAANWLAHNLRTSQEELQEMVQAGNDDAAWIIARRASWVGSVAELRALADSGNRHAARHLGSILTYHREAIPELRLLAAKYPEEALWYYAKSLAVHGEEDQLRDLTATTNHEDVQYHYIEYLYEAKNEPELRRIAAMGSNWAQLQLGTLLREQSNEDALLELAIAGDPHATQRLGELFYQQGRFRDLQLLGLAGSRDAVRLLTYHLGSQNDVDGIRNLVEATGVGSFWEHDFSVVQPLTKRLIEQNRRPELKELLLTLSTAGSSYAEDQLAGLADTEQELRRLLITGNDYARLRLLRQLRGEGREQEAEVLLRFGVKPDGSTAFDGTCGIHDAQSG